MHAPSALRLPADSRLHEEAPLEPVGSDAPEPTAGPGRQPSALQDLISLTKPRLSSLVLFTAGGGLWLADRPVSLTTTLAAVFGTTLVVGGANALNCYLERDTDRLMARTRTRPLPAGRMAPRRALVFGLTLSLISVPALTLLGSPIAGLLAAIALLLYVLVYTPLKRVSSFSTLIGAIPGALPPLIGWTAASGRLDAGGLVLFALLFLWQIPHSLAIGTYRQHEYEQAGLVVFPSEHGAEATRRQALLYTLPQIALPLVLVHLGVAGTVTLVGSAILGLHFLYLVARWHLQGLGANHARKVFFGSLIYLTGLFVVLVVDQLIS
jgi:protoheme IX farnesyltransferase